MYIQLNGMLTKRKDNIYFKNNDGLFEMSGEDIELFHDISPYLTGTISFKEILEIKNESDQLEIFNNFKNMEENGLIKISEKPFIQIGVISESFSTEKLKQLFNSKSLKEVLVIENLENINTEEIDYFLVVDQDENEKYYKKINRIFSEKKIPWIKYSFNQNNLYLGPAFFRDGGPCLECYLTRKKRNQGQKENDFSFSMGDTGLWLNFFVEKEIFKLANLDSPSLCFNSEIILNTLDLEISKYSVYKLPDCKECGDETYE